ncbi:MAG: glycosyltransferase [Chitinophagaceae bacterium]|nr:glycosyltransferase [Chitinophagaceae bacterium]
MRVLYIGHYDVGSTSRMRGEYLKELLPGGTFTVINIDPPLNATPKIMRSIGWRYKKGPLIRNINNYIRQQLSNNYSYDLVWIDKGVFVDPEIVFSLKNNSGRLVHFTPDPAFTYHRSRLFYEALPQYDYCVTTKSFEIESYKAFGVKTIFCTQGFDPRVHKPHHTPREKQGVVFIGHKEEEREYIVSKLVEKNIKITIAGNHWEKFSARRKHKSNLIYKGKGIFGDDYAKELSAALLGLGLLSRWVPELHTTRTFEIPACGTALVTEHNPEIGSVFSDDEVIYYDDAEEAIEKIEHYVLKRDKLLPITENGFKKVTEGGYSYPEILSKILKQVNG